jgi:hypothetical protein
MNFLQLGSLLVMAPILAAAPATADGLVLKRVMLSTGGVAYMEYEAQVTGNGELTLDVPLDQIDDVLKSIVVYDSKGLAGSASLPGRNPLAETFKDLPFGADALDSPAALFNALQGSEIKVGASHPITGRLLKVVPETVQLDHDQTATRNRVSVLTATGLQQFILEDAESISFVDADLQAKVSQALSEIAAQRAKDRRQIKLSSHGNGQRLVRVGYVVGAPLWKASYRLTLPAGAAADKAHLQGWAVLENMSGQDWKGVELTLLSGNPVSFRQAIYEAYYVNRPEVPVEVAGRILPKPDSGVMGEPADKEFRQRDGSAAMRSMAGGAANAMQALPAPSPPASPAPARAADLAPSFNTAEATEGLTQVSFRLPTPITITGGQSAIVPLFDHDIPITRLALYQPETVAAHPLASVRLKNDSPNGLPPGVLTLYEDTSAGVSYVGDARLNALPAAEERLVSYAVDEKTKISREQQSQSTLTQASFAQGVLSLTRVLRQTTIYKLAGPAAEPRRVLLEQPKIQGWKLLEPADHGVEQTAIAYRAAVDLKPGETKDVKFVLEIPSVESHRISDIDDRQIAEVTSNGGIDASIKKSLAELVRLRRAVADSTAAEKQLKSRIDGLKDDQARIRDNVAKIDKDNALYKRYIEKLTEQETQFETLQATSAKAADETRAASAAVDAYIAKLSS